MKRRSPLPLSPLVVAAAALLAQPQAARADASPADASSPVADNSPPREFHPLVGALVTGNISPNDQSLANPDGSTATGNLGGRYEVFAGAEFPLTKGGLRLRLTAGAHEGRVSPSAGGSEHFVYYPLEASLVYPVSDTWRLGGGVRYPARIKFSGPGAHSNLGLGSAPGAVGFIEWAVVPHVWLDLRFVAEDFEPYSGGSITTNHWGLGAVAEY